MSVTVTCGVQGPQGPPGPAGAPVSNIATIVESEVLTSVQNTTLFLNTGASAEVDLTLPPVQSPFVPLTFSMLVAAAQDFSFVAPAGVIIINGSDSSSAGGSISSNIVGNFLTIIMVSATQWVVTNITGVWNLE